MQPGYSNILTRFSPHANIYILMQAIVSLKAAWSVIGSGVVVVGSVMYMYMFRVYLSAVPAVLDCAGNVF